MIEFNLDIEGAEYEIIPQLVELADRIDQLLIARMISDYQRPEIEGQKEDVTGETPGSEAAAA